MCPGGPILYGADTFGTYTGNYRDPEVSWRRGDWPKIQTENLAAEPAWKIYILFCADKRVMLKTDDMTTEKNCLYCSRSKGRDGHFRVTVISGSLNLLQIKIGLNGKCSLSVFSSIHLSIKSKTEKTSRYPFFPFSFGNEYWEKELFFSFSYFWFYFKKRMNEWYTDCGWPSVTP